ncbi:hypothetical protein [Sediminibacillus albus]|uniref:DUF2798 domain-containing protein n=1 Tax=Sediminibacillus albus TaxID=407036 RepID=A0A1G8Y6I5_9BACI|nr:hypothetical protein [Sediminibacillus albus]SDJ98426.1 hypothetical protein SAMN05216243_1436 [Sediminibacillus albus]
MPTTRKENFYFGMTMCIGMVIFMTFYNLFVNGLLGTISFRAILIQLIIGFMIAFLLELFLVGPAAHKLAIALPFTKSKDIYRILSISFFMVVGMVHLMSIYGMVVSYLFNGLGEESILRSYYSIVLKNFIFALPLQLIIMGPAVRYLFGKFVISQRSAQGNAAN